MIIGTGVDIEKVSRFKDHYEDKHFIELIFSPSEIAYCMSKQEPYISFAGKFCAKEAVIKALPDTISIKDIEIINQESGKVKVRIKGEERTSIHCSISHTPEYAIAYVVVEQ